LTGSGLVLQNNAGDDLTISADGSFTFATALTDGSTYNVTVSTQPSNPSQTCTVTSDTDTINGANVTNVLIDCAHAAPASTSFGQGLSVSAAPKVLTFSWPETGADYYKLLKNPDGASGFTQVGNNMSTTSADEAVAVHWHDWAQASYLLEACDAQDNCLRSLPIGTGPAMQDAIGYFKASSTAAGAPGYQFGTSTALSADGKTLAVGAPVENANTGAVSVFTLKDGTWVEEAYLTAANPLDANGFGQRVALSEDGDTLAVGTPNDHTQGFNAGSVSVFTRTSGSWTQEAQVTAQATEAGDQFGYSIALSADGHTLAVGANAEDASTVGLQGGDSNNGAPNAGAAYVFTRSGNSWSQQAYFKASNTDAGDQFGTQVALSSDGQTLAVSAPFESSSAWGAGGNQANNSASESGAVYVFTETGGSWSQQVYLKASNTDAGDQFGTGLSLSSNGDTLAVGAQYEASNTLGVDGDETDNSTTGAGAVYVFSRNAGTWSQEGYLKSSNTEGGDFFGISTSLTADGNSLAVGATGEDSDATGANGDLYSNFARDAGAVYVFTRSTNGWSQKTYLKAANTGEADTFGQSVSFSADGDTLAVGAPGERSNATGIQGDQTNDSSPSAGAVYLY
ncbi:MAG: FG-GAP repeat protein, partial [Gammaproteobacteria bacterium]|nr:FG-GAP repeat protein [Gammaproteobacteria bacterium]